MVNYTERLARLMQDIASRVPTLNFIDVADMSLPYAAGERAWLLLLAGSEYRTYYAAVRVVRDQIAFGHDGRTAREIHDFLHAAAVL